jgi:hypothetical protein
LPKHREFSLHFIKNKWGNHKCTFHKNLLCEVYRVGNKTQLWTMKMISQCAINIKVISIITIMSRNKIYFHFQRSVSRKLLVW